MPKHSRLILVSLLLATVTAVGAARAGTTLTLPAAGEGSVSGGGLIITNKHNFGEDGPRPYAIEGVATGSSAGGVLGETRKSDGHAIEGDNDGTGAAGYFILSGANPDASSAAVEALATGGSSTTPGNYGSAGSFAILNAMNTSNAVTINTSGPGIALSVEATGGGSSIESVVTQAGAAAVYGFDESANGGYGVLGATDAGYAVYGESLEGYAGYFTHQGSNCNFSGGPGWNCTSDRNLKDHFADVDLDALLDRLAGMPVFTYQMKHSALPTRYLGPTAQDFKAAFDLGDSDKTINTANAQGVALAAAKGLYQKLKADEAIIATDHELIATQAATIASLQQTLNDRMAKLEAALAESGKGERQAALIRR